MKIAVTSMGPSMSDLVDPRFGRAAYILIVDRDSLAVEVIDNMQNMQAIKGAGIQAATSLSKTEATVLLTGNCGPNAFKVLQTAGIEVVNVPPGKVSDAIEAFNRGELRYSDKANVEAHW